MQSLTGKVVVSPSSSQVLRQEFVSVSAEGGSRQEGGGYSLVTEGGGRDHQGLVE